MAHRKFGLRFDFSVVFLIFLPSPCLDLALNNRGEAAPGRGSRGLAANADALVAGNDAKVHGAGIHGVRANVQGTLAPERKGSQLCSLNRLNARKYLSLKGLAILPKKNPNRNQICGLRVLTVSP